MGLADATILGNAVDGVLFVSGAGIVRRGAALTALERLRATGSDVIGGVLERFDSKKAAIGGYGYEYAYSYEYGAADDEPSAGKRRKRKA